MYGKIFDSIYDGTLVEDWRALITFQQFIVLCDADGVVDMTAAAISRRTGIPIEHIKAGIDLLENPDPYSRTPDEEGCRIKRLDEHRPWGWYLVNHQKYKSLQDADTVRAQNRERKRRQRERDKSRNVTDGHASSRHIDTDTNTDTDKLSPPSGEGAHARKRAKRLPDDFTLTPERRAVAEAEKVPAERTFEKFVDYWRAASGQKARKHDWDATWRNWCRREADSNPRGRAAASSDPYYDELREAVGDARD